MLWYKRLKCNFCGHWMSETKETTGTASLRGIKHPDKQGNLLNPDKSGWFLATVLLKCGTPFSFVWVEQQAVSAVLPQRQSSLPPLCWLMSTIHSGLNPFTLVQASEFIHSEFAFETSIHFNTNMIHSELYTRISLEINQHWNRSQNSSISFWCINWSNSRDWHKAEGNKIYLKQTACWAVFKNMPRHTVVKGETLTVDQVACLKLACSDLVCQKVA